MNLADKLKAGKRLVKKIKWPGTDFEVGLTVLSEAELQDAAFETERRFNQAGIEVKLLEMAAVYDKEKVTQILFRSLVDPATRNRLFSSADDLRSLFVSPAVKDVLVEAYNELQEECSPSPATHSEDELRAIFETVKKTPETGTSLSSSTLRELLRFMVSQPATSPKDSGSTSIV